MNSQAKVTVIASVLVSLVLENAIAFGAPAKPHNAAGAQSPVSRTKSQTGIATDSAPASNNSDSSLSRAEKYLTLARYNEAKAIFDQSISLHPSARAYLGRAAALSALSAADEDVIEACTRALYLDFRLAHAYSLRAACYYRLGYSANAVADCQSSLDLDPNDHESLHIRANIHGDNGNWLAAANDYSTILKRDPDDIRALEDRSLAYQSLGRSKESQSDLAAAIALGPKRASLYHDHGMGYLDVKRADLYYGHAFTYKDAGNLKAAIADFSKSIELNPHDNYEFCARGCVEAHMRNYQQAIKDCDKSIALNPKWPHAYYTRGYSNLMLGKPKAAVIDLEQYTKLDPKYGNGYYALSKAYRGVGNNELAQQNELLAKQHGSRALTLALP
jgi:tetratricopeptide (TPR) repeat protein